MAGEEEWDEATRLPLLPHCFFGIVLSFDYVIRARARAMRRDVTTCGVVTTATSTATVTSAGRDRMARCGVWVGLSRDRPPHMPLDLTCNH